MSQRKKTATNTVTFLIHMCNIMVKAHVTDITITGNFLNINVLCSQVCAAYIVNCYAGWY